MDRRLVYIFNKIHWISFYFLDLKNWSRMDRRQVYIFYLINFIYFLDLTIFKFPAGSANNFHDSLSHMISANNFLDSLYHMICSLIFLDSLSHVISANFFPWFTLPCDLRKFFSLIPFLMWFPHLFFLDSLYQDFLQICDFGNCFLCFGDLGADPDFDLVIIVISSSSCIVWKKSFFRNLRVLPKYLSY